MKPEAKIAKSLAEKIPYFGHKIFLEGKKKDEIVLRREQRGDKIVYYRNGECKTNGAKEIYIKNPLIRESIKRILEKASPIIKYIHFPNSISSAIEEIVQSNELLN